MKNFYKKNSYLTETQLETLEKKFHEKYYYVPHLSELERMYLEDESFKPTFDKEEYDLYQKNIYNEEIIRKIFKFKTISLMHVRNMMLRNSASSGACVFILNLPRCQ
jgi:hypothetical protein